MAKTMNVNLVFNANTKQVKEQLNELKASLNGLSSNITLDQNMSSFSKQTNAALGSLTNLRAMLDQATTSSGQLNISKFSLSMQKAGISLASLRKDLSAFGAEGEEAFLQLSRSILDAQQPIKQTNQLIDKLWGSMKNVATWQISSRILYGFMNQISSAYQYTQDLNESLNNIRIVTGYGTDEMSKFAEQSNKAAKALSASTLQYTDAALIYYQQGLNNKEVMERANTTIKLANVARASGEEASEWMTAIWNNFYDGSKSLEYYADVLTKLGADTASSADEIAGGLEKFSAVANTVGLSYEYAASALATITAQTRQSEDVVGTSLKTLFARIENLSLGDTLDDGTTLSKYSEALYKVGINIKDTSGELKSMDTILNEMGATWGTLSKDQQIALAQTVGGIRQYNQLIALMDNWDFFEKNVANAKNATGELNKQNDIYAESWEAANKRIQASMEGLYQSVLEDDFFIKLTNITADFVEGLDKVIDSVGGLKTILPGLVFLFTKLFGQKMLVSARDLAYNISLTSKQAQQRNAELKMSAASNALKEGDASASEYTRAATGALQRQEAITQALSQGTRELTQAELDHINVLKQRLNLQEELFQKNQKKLDNLNNEELPDAESKKNKAKKEYHKFQEKQSRQISESYQETRKLGSGIVQIDARKFQSALQTSKNVEDFIAKLEDGENVLDGFKTKLKDAYREYQKLIESNEGLALKQDIQSATEEVDNLKNKIKATADAGNDMEESIKEASDAIVKDIKNINMDYDWDQAFMSLTNGAMSAAMAFGMLQSTIETFQSPDATGMEKFTAVLMTIGSTLPLVLPLLKLLFSETARNTLVTNLDSLAIALNNKQKENAVKLDTAATNVKKILTKRTEEKAVAEGEEAAATEARKAAQNAPPSDSVPIPEDAPEVDPSTGKTFGKSAGKLLKALGPYLLAAALVAVGIVIIKSLTDSYNKSAKVLEKAKEDAKKTQEEVTKTKEAYDDLLNSTKSYQDSLKGLEELTAGTEEYNKALVEANYQAQELINKYKDYQDLKYTVVNGVITIDEDSLEQIAKYQSQELAIAQMNNTIAQQKVLNAQQALDEVTYLRQQSQVKGIDEQDKKYGGWGAAAGATIGGGAAIGTLAAFGALNTWNPAGLVALGVAAAGAIIGGIIGAVQADDSQREHDMMEALKKEYNTVAKASTATGDKADNDDSWDNLYEVLKKQGYQDAEIKAFLTDDLSGIQEILKENARIEEEILEQNKLMVHQLNLNNELYTELDSDEQAAVQGYIAGHQDQIKESLTTSIDNPLIKDKVFTGYAYPVDSAPVSAWDVYRSDDKATNKKQMNPIEAGYKAGPESSAAFTKNLRQLFIEMQKEKGKSVTYRHTEGHETFYTIAGEGEEEITYKQMSDQVLEWLSKKVTPENITAAIEHLNTFKTGYGNVLYNLNDKDRQNLIGQFTSRSISNVTMLSQQEIDQLKQLQDKDYWEGLQSQVIAAEEQRAAILENINQNYNETVQGIVKDKDLAGITSTLNIDEYRNLYELAEKFASANFEDKDLLKKVLGQSTDPAKTIETLNSIDYPMTNVEAVAAKMGGEIDTTTEEFKKLTEGLIENAIAAEADVDYFNKIIKALGEIKKIVEKLNIGDVISTEEYDSLIAKNAALADSFVRVADGYMLIEDASQFSEKALKSYDTTLDGAVTQAEKYSAAAKTIKELINEQKINTGASTQKDKIAELNKLKENNLDTYNAILTRGGYDTNQNLNALSGEQVAELFKVITELVNTENIGGFSRVNTITSKLDLYSDSYSESQALIEKTATTEEEKVTLQKTANALLRNELELEDDVVNSLKGQVKYLAQENGILIQNDTLLESMALRYEALNKGVKNLVTNWESYEDAIQEGNQAETFANIKKDLSTMFNIDNKDISDTFVSSYWEDIKNLAQGTGDTEQIVNNLSQALAIAKLSADNLGNATKEAIIGTLQSSELMTLAYGEVVDANTSVMIGNLNRLLEAGKITASQLIEYFIIAGYQLDLTKDKLINSIRNVGTGSALNLNAYRSNVSKNAGSAKEADEFDPKRYHEIDEVLDDISKKLDIISTKKDKAFGKDKIHWMDQELKLLQDDLDATNQRLEEANQHYQADKAAIMKYGVELDNEGRIINYDEVRQHYYDQYKTNPEAYEDSWNKLNEELDRYEETLNTVQDLEQEQLDKWYAIKDAALEKIEFTVEFKVETSEDTLKLLDYMLKQLDDDAYYAAEAIDVLGRKTQTTLNDIKTYNEGITNILKGANFTGEEIERFFTDDQTVFEGKTLTDKEVEMLREYRDNLIESEETLIELRDTVFETALNSFNAWNEKLNENADKLERCNTLLEAHRNIIDVVGKSYLGIDNELLGSIAEARTDIALGSVEAAAATFKANQATLEEAKANLEKAILEDDKESIKKWEEFVKEVEATTNESEEQMMSKLTEAMELAGEIFEETVERAMETLNEALGNIEKLQDKFDKQRQLEELYLADHKKLYEINKLNRDIQNSIDQTDNVKAQRELAAIAQEVMAYQADGAQMSKYDLEYLQKRYELKKAEIALEEAQNAKNQVKLQRDAKGNWGYVYTADQGNIDKAQENYNKSLYELQEFEYSSQRDLTEKWLDLNKQMMDELAKLRASDFASAEEYEAKRQEIIAHYTQMANGVLYEIKDLTYQSSIVNREYNLEMADTFEETLLGRMYPTYSSFEELTTAIGSAIDQAMVALGSTYTTWSLTVDGAFEAAGIDAKTYADYMATKFVPSIQKSVNDTVKEAETLANKMKEHLLGTDGKGGAIGAVADFETKFASHMEDVRKANGLTIESIQGVSTAATKMAEDVAKTVGEVSGYISDLEKSAEKAAGLKGNIYGNDDKNNNTGKYTISTAMDTYDMGGTTFYKDHEGNWYHEGDIEYYGPSEGGPEYKFYGSGLGVSGSVQDLINWHAGDNDNRHEREKAADTGSYTDYIDYESRERMTYAYTIDDNGTLWLQIGNQWYKRSQLEKKTSTPGSYGVMVQIKNGEKGSDKKPNNSQKYPFYKEQDVYYGYNPSVIQSVKNGVYKIKFKDDGTYITTTELKSLSDDTSKGFPIEKLTRLDTGGYTGSWGTDGRLAMLHQKEIVLNAHDTENFLSAVKIVRSMSDMLEHNAHVAMQGLNLEQNFTRLLNNKQPIDQNVRIEAHFPNVTDRYEIEQAFNSLVNDATQYVNRN